MWGSFTQLAQGVRDQATAAVQNAGLDSQLVRTRLAQAQGSPVHARGSPKRRRRHSKAAQLVLEAALGAPADAGRCGALTGPCCTAGAGQGAGGLPVRQAGQQRAHPGARAAGAGRRGGSPSSQAPAQP